MIISTAYFVLIQGVWKEILIARKGANEVMEPLTNLSEKIIYNNTLYFKVFSDKNFKRQWDALLPADKVILSMIAHGVGDLHSLLA
ncbi:hypothetical protein [Legionella sp.]|uniref:hypothetical protein n=1 Tax=Legionella sp. TaxID=459 RepID=UPI003CAB8961